VDPAGLGTPATSRWSEIQRVPGGRTGFGVVAADRARLVGEVVDLDEFDVLTLRAGAVTLLLDVDGTAPAGIVGTTVGVLVDELEPYPVRY
jgi:hypothetical protein